MKLKITRTYGPIHFEDLDPHHFEDLIRELIYDYKDWQSIEATGRSGSDDGFDVRAYEKVDNTSNYVNEENDEVIETPPMEGNLWMIQGKREREIGPNKIKSILLDINPKNPPYGYILAASANFSKKTYDLFRNEAREKGVMEFYLWGKAELEDMLHLPKNDRILFTFFGISLVSKRRSRTTEIRSVVNIKNKFFRILGEDLDSNKWILIRDLTDTNYPYEYMYADFLVNPRWIDYLPLSYHPLGLLFKHQEYYAYIDNEKQEWDFTDELDLTIHSREADDESVMKSNIEKRNRVLDFWEYLPRKNKCFLMTIGLVKYSDIAIFDEKGDNLYYFPHIYVDFNGKTSPFSKQINVLKVNNEEIPVTDNYKRINIFPDKFTKGKIGKIHNNDRVILKSECLKEFNQHHIDTIYETSDKYEFLQPRDILAIEIQGNAIGEAFIEITYKLKSNAKNHLEQTNDSYKTRKSIELQLGHVPEDEEEIYIYEFKRVHHIDFLG